MSGEDERVCELAAQVDGEIMGYGRTSGERESREGFRQESLGRGTQKGKLWVREPTYWALAGLHLAAGQFGWQPSWTFSFAESYSGPLIYALRF